MNYQVSNLFPLLLFYNDMLEALELLENLYQATAHNLQRQSIPLNLICHEDYKNNRFNFLSLGFIKKTLLISSFTANILYKPMCWQRDLKYSLHDLAWRITSPLLCHPSIHPSATI